MTGSPDALDLAPADLDNNLLNRPLALWKPKTPSPSGKGDRPSDRGGRG